MARKFRYTEKVIKESLKSSEDLCKKGLLALWQYNPRYNDQYTPEVQDQMDGFVTEYRDAERDLLFGLAKHLMDRGYLTDNQTRAVKNRIPKYATLLTELANKQFKLPPIPVPDSDAILAEGRKIYWFRTEAGKTGMFDQPDIFDSKNKTSIKARIPITEEDAMALWFPKKCTKVVESGDGIKFIGIPKWLCEKNKIPFDLAIDDEDLPEALGDDETSD